MGHSCAEFVKVKHNLSTSFNHILWSSKTPRTRSGYSGACLPNLKGTKRVFGGSGYSATGVRQPLADPSAGGKSEHGRTMVVGNPHRPLAAGQGQCHRK